MHLVHDVGEGVALIGEEFLEFVGGVTVDPVASGTASNVLGANRHDTIPVRQEYARSAFPLRNQVLCWFHAVLVCVGIG